MVSQLQLERVSNQQVFLQPDQLVYHRGNQVLCLHRISRGCWQSDKGSIFRLIDLQRAGWVKIDS
ncbi:MAG: hypothetical protein HC835_13435 [Oscillatoriales cyanobacterium RM2_1_1]|nr:hypothetical protein [Oscillatoriales cyanobacterium SM2_3_0]NJO46548.1 hypothetical protein [Oscillatoriales cyanobacterium RM2_1_1]